jgi:hypothetical protein
MGKLEHEQTVQSFDLATESADMDTAYECKIAVRVVADVIEVITENLYPSAASVVQGEAFAYPGQNAGCLARALLAKHERDPGLLATEELPLVRCSRVHLRDPVLT